jgi:enamine deaminase RidA (YjgF/YER057c/UK114 family)
MPGKIDARLAELGIALPEPAAPAGAYVPYVVTGSLVFVAGQITLENGEIKYKGRLGESMGVEDGYAAARLCGLNLLAQVRGACAGDLDRVKRVVRLGGFVNSAAVFTDQAKVINGASDLMVEVFGDPGRHARAAVGAPSLPLGVSVEVDGIFEIA